MVLILSPKWILHHIRVILARHAELYQKPETSIFAHPDSGNAVPGKLFRIMESIAEHSLHAAAARRFECSYRRPKSLGLVSALFGGNAHKPAASHPGSM